MSFEPVRSERGHPRIRCSCADCGRQEVVAGDHGKGGNGQAVRKLARLGWSYLNKRLRCAQCEAKRKVRKMASGSAADQAPRRPTREQKREIMGLLDVAYDVDAERYKGGDTDATLADVLGVLPGWVSEIRDEFYGPDGGNAELETLRADVDGFISSAQPLIEASRAAADALCRHVEEVAALRERLGRIQKAVGPRVCAKAGVK